MQLGGVQQLRYVLVQLALPEVVFEKRTQGSNLSSLAAFMVFLKDVTLVRIQAQIVKKSIQVIHSQVPKVVECDLSHRLARESGDLPGQEFKKDSDVSRVIQAS